MRLSNTNSRPLCGVTKRSGQPCDNWAGPSGKCVHHGGPSLEVTQLKARVAKLEAALRRTLSRCTNCDTCGPARCPECETDFAVLSESTKERP